MSLVVWLPLINNIENQGTENLPVPTVNTTTKNTTYGKLGSSSMAGCLLWHLSEEILGNAWSVCTWINSSYFYQYNNIIFCKNIKDSQDCQIYFSIINNNQLNVGVNGSSGSLAYTSQTFALNTWYHVATTYDGSKVSLYINGTLVKSGTVSTAMPTGRLNIGIDCRSTNDAGTASTGSSYRFNDFRLYNHALSQREVKEISKGLIVHYSLDNNGSGQANLLSRYVSAGQKAPGSTSNGGRTLYYRDYGIQIPATENADTYFRLFLKEQLVVGDTYTISCHASGLLSGTYYRFPLFAQGNTSMGVLDINHNGLNQLTFTMNSSSQTAVQVSSSETVYICFMDDSGRNIASGQGTITLTNFKIEKGSKVTPWTPASTDPRYAELGFSNNIVYDSSGYCNNGTINGSLTYLEDCPRYSLSTKFVDNNSRIRVQVATSGFTNSYTFSWWGKYTNYASHMMWGFGDGNRLNLYMMSGNFYWNTGDGANNPFNVSAATYGDSQWHYFAVTGDGTTAKLYIDGEFKANAKTYKGITGTVLFFNGWDTGTNYKFNGNLSDFRLYATPLSAEDILELYHTSASVSDNGTLFAYTFNEE